MYPYIFITYFKKGFLYVSNLFEKIITLKELNVFYKITTVGQPICEKGNQVSLCNNVWSYFTFFIGVLEAVSAIHKHEIA